MTSKPLLMTVREVAAFFRIQRAKVYYLIQDGYLKGFKLGSEWRVRLDSVEQLGGTIPTDFFRNLDEQPQGA